MDQCFWTAGWTSVMALLGGSGPPHYCTSICVRSCCTRLASCVDLINMFRSFSLLRMNHFCVQNKPSWHKSTWSVSEVQFCTWRIVLVGKMLKYSRWFCSPCVVLYRIAIKYYIPEIHQIELFKFPCTNLNKTRIKNNKKTLYSIFVWAWSKKLKNLHVTAGLVSMVQVIGDSATYLGRSCWSKSFRTNTDSLSRNRMNSSTRQQTNSSKVKTRHKIDAVKRLYWALIYHEYNTDITAIPVTKLACYHTIV